MTYAPHRADSARRESTRRAPARHASPRRPRAGGPDERRARIWIAGGMAASAGLVAFGAWAVVTTPPPVMTVTAAPVDSALGGFDVDVTGVRCGVDSVGPSGLAQEATGQFCLLDVKVTNNGREPVLFDSGAQRVRDADGVAYAVAEQAAVFLNDRDATLLNEIDPGDTVTGVLPFDMPVGARPSDAELSDGMSTAGVRVTLPDPR
ncbi:DUF4352 domain-containing protein [Actinoplanes sp. G11-F43]|uniref:DUF4352 domain-containing protein n=1 Tax=Actinoplanes sp. G11-F43 TaxID=3424130 RepID=UPI003D3585FC